MDRMRAMLETKVGSLQMCRTIGRDWYCSWTQLKRQGTRARYNKCLMFFAFSSCSGCVFLNIFVIVPGADQNRDGCCSLRVLD